MKTFSGRFAALFALVLGCALLLAIQQIKDDSAKESALAWVFILGGLAVYFFPSVLARHNNHQNTPAIFALNLFLGWTFIGWVAALVWALVKPRNQFS